MGSRLLASLAICLASPGWSAEAAVEAPLATPRPTLDLGAGYRGFTRSFGLDNGSTSLPRFDGVAGGVGVEAQCFPFASVAQGLGGNLGLYGEGQFSLGLAAVFNGKLYEASATTLRGSVALRVPFDASELLLHAGVGYQAFTLATKSVDGSGTLGPSDLGLLGPRVGLGYRLQLARAWSVQARAAMLITLSRGKLGELYPASSGFGLDAALSVSVTVVPGVQLRLAGDWSRAFLNLAPFLTATEQQFGGAFLVAVAL
jgi:hypothetical protein